MSGENYTNTASVATTAAPMGPSDTSVVVANYTGFPAAPYWAELEKGTASAEIVRVTSVAGTTLTLTRGQGGTAATSHGAGVNVEHIVPASHFNETEAHMADTSAHGVTGDVVGTSGAQTVSDKNFRGAFRADYTDALPAGITASFESVADSAAARDGFVHRNTAGDPDRKAFLAQQSGTDRVSVFNDGTVDLNPAVTSTRPGLRSRGTTQLDGDVTASGSLTVTGPADLNGGIDVTGGIVAAGGAIITGTTALDDAQVDSLTSSGAISGTDGTFSGTLAVTGAVTASSTIAATGAVSGASATFTNAVTSYGGRVIPSVTSFPASPVDGQVVYRADEVMFYRYSLSGGSWGRWEPYAPKCELRQTSSQTIGSGAWTALTFQAEDLDTHDGHAAGSAEYVVPAGWTGTLRLTGGVGWVADTGTSRGVRWAKNGVPVAGGAATVANSSTINLIVPARERKVTVVPGDVITLEAWQNKGSDVDTAVSNENQSHMSIEWVLR